MLTAFVTPQNTAGTLRLLRLLNQGTAQRTIRVPHTTNVQWIAGFRWTYCPGLLAVHAFGARGCRGGTTMDNRRSRQRGALMSGHDGAYRPERRRAQGISERFADPSFVTHGIELQRRVQPPWPRSVRGEYAMIADLVAEASHPSDSTDAYTSTLSVCGCGKRHDAKVALRPFRACSDR